MRDWLWENAFWLIVGFWSMVAIAWFFAMWQGWAL